MSDAFRVTKSGRLLRSIDEPQRVYRDDRPAEERQGRAVQIGPGAFKREKPTVQRTFLEEAEAPQRCINPRCPGICSDCADDDE